MPSEDDLADTTTKLTLQEDPKDGQLDADHFKEVIRHRHQAKDVTAEFSAHCKALSTGQLVKNDSFTLFESVYGLEMMDPKMDSGYVAPGESVESGFDTSKPLLPEEVLWIIDQLISCEMAWLRGWSLSQTLLLNVYIDALLVRPREKTSLPEFPGAREDCPWLHLVLKAYCVGAIIGADMINEFAISQGLHEDEDFITPTYGRDLLSDVSDVDWDGIISEALRYLESLERTTVVQALTYRISAQQKFLKFFATGRADWRVQLVYSRIIKATHSEGKEVEGIFEPKIQYKLSISTAPRPPVTLSFEDSIAEHEQMNTFFDVADNIVRYLQEYPSLYQAHVPHQTLLDVFGSSNPSPLSRAYLQFRLLSENSEEQTIAQTLTYQHFHPITSLREGILGPEIYLSKTGETLKPQELVDLSVNVIVPTVDALLRTLCQNRSRARRNLTNLLPEICELPRMLDTELQSTYLDPQGHTPDFPARRLESGEVQHLDHMKVLAPFLLQVSTLLQAVSFELEVFECHELGDMYMLFSSLSKNQSKHIKGTASRIHSSQTLSQSNEVIRKSIAQEVSLRLRQSEMLQAASYVAEALANLYHILTCTSLLPIPPQPTHPFPATPAQLTYRLRPFIPLNQLHLNHHGPNLDSLTNHRLRVQHQIQPLLELQQPAKANAKTTPQLPALLTSLVMKKLKPARQILRGKIEMDGEDGEEWKVLGKILEPALKWNADGGDEKREGGGGDGSISARGDGRASSVLKGEPAELYEVVRDIEGVCERLVEVSQSGERKAAEDGKGMIESLKERVQVEVPQRGKTRSSMWIVPGVQIK
ncbi:MAG: hypothetical protein M1831_007033 [Alyxoria varia]|nr:MAG: hypothetical protein M1831_007033 [Alyxoria varia]